MHPHLQTTKTTKRKETVSGKITLPAFNPDHVLNMTDGTGIIQHALRNIPNRKEGYCTDDNSRALLLTVLAWKQNRHPEMLKLMSVYLSFIHYMQMEDGYFHNFMLYNKHIVIDGSSEDAYGRTIMALGYLIADGPSPLTIKTAEDIFLKAAPHMDNLISLRGIANSLIGLCMFIGSQHPLDGHMNRAVQLADKLVHEYRRYSDKHWCWFEEVLTYDNAMIPLALLHAYGLARQEEYLQIALESISFLESKVFVDGVLHPVGNNGWCSKGGTTALFDQQPLDAMAMVLFYQQAFYITGDKKFLTRGIRSWQWFMGDNALKLPLYDKDTGGCSDGLQPDRVNENQGAESTIAFWIAYFAVSEMLDR
ncbi:glycosyltransferase [Chitinophaga filiformis]|uniref:glycosyltransferase n=1 Tax=Chitinophaga filiformis TaxID=104663 RepID=UPI001F29DD60|nr:glycosyltransferase [Chitinophaga filiformis]MCF6404432.1 glycosyltransferase [Chitinophaga filiformis]